LPLAWKSLKHPLLNIRLPSPRALAALLILFTVAAYLPAIGAGYIWDDDTLLTANPQMRSLAGLEEIWRGEHSRDYTPVTLSTFWLEWHLWGATPTGYHVVNILLHALSAVLLWMILERLGVPGAWLGALLFAVHPVNVASVAWVAERKNALSGALFFGAVWCWLCGRGGQVGRSAAALYWGAVGLFVLAVLSKGAVVTLPAVLLLCVLWKDRRVTWRDVWELAPFAVAAVVGALLTVRFQARAQHYGLIPDSLDFRIARAGAAVWFYLGSLFWPAGMSPMRQQWLPNLRAPMTYFPALAAAALPVIFYFRRRTWGRPLLFGYAYFVIMLLPVLGFVWMTFMQETPSADWWQYMAAPGIFACVAAGIATASRHWRIVMPLFALFVILLVIQTWRRAAIYHSLQTYCDAVTAEDPHAWTLQNNLGILLKRQGRYAEAEACYRQALRDNPGYVEAHINMSNALGAAGDLDGAEGELRLAARMRPGDPMIIRNLAGLGGTLAGSGRFAGAEACFRDAIAQAPDSIGLRIGLCQTLAAQGNKEAALAVCAEVDQLARTSSDPNALEAAAKLRQDCERAPAPR
jgi:Tfp pilus assembly protein PilF